MRKKSLLQMLAAVILLAACSKPRSAKAVATMKQYWNFYKAGQYGSLDTFYLYLGINPAKNFERQVKTYKLFLEDYGPIDRVELIKPKAEASGGRSGSIVLTYRVTHRTAIFTYRVELEENKQLVYKIASLSANRVEPPGIQ